jgi:hypothetical protein
MIPGSSPGTAALGAGLCCLALAVLLFFDLTGAAPESPQAVNSALPALIYGFAGVLLAACAFAPMPA